MWKFLKLKEIGNIWGLFGDTETLYDKNNLDEVWSEVEGLSFIPEPFNKERTPDGRAELAKKESGSAQI